MSATREQPWLNHGGTTPDNPLIEGLVFRIRLAKHNAAETLRKVWVVTDKSIVSDLRHIAVETDYEIYVDVEAGVHLRAGFPPVRNVIHFTTSDHRHARGVVWCATEPPAMIHLDGYSGHDPTKPLIVPLYAPELGII